MLFRSIERPNPNAMSKLMRRPNSSHVRNVISLSARHEFSRLSASRRHTPHEPTRLRGAQPAERSIRVLSKEGGKLPSDFGLLENTFIAPTGTNRPSILKSPLLALHLERTRLLARARDYLSLLISKFSSPKETSFWSRAFSINRSTIAPTALALHRQMYLSFAEGDSSALQKICLDGILDNFRVRIASRPREEKLVWELVKYNRSARLISNRAAKTPIDGMLIHQSVVKISSTQKLTRYTRAKNGELQQIPGSGREKDVVENLVLQRTTTQWKPGSWMIWGTAKETTIEDIEKWYKV